MAKKEFYLQSTKAKGLQFKIVKLDKESMIATLKGDTGVEFTQSVKPDNLAKFGYEVLSREPTLAPVSAE